MTDAVRARLGHFLEKDVRNAPARYYYAMTLWKHLQYQPNAVELVEIESLLKRAISLDPKYADAYLQLGIVYISERKYSEAIQQYEQALKINPNMAAIHYRLGQALTRTGASDRAKKEFADFERLHSQEIADTGKQNAEIQQFVYTMRNSNAAVRE
jgi:tetratricopeptide (TPR) repeat protein